MIQPGKILKSLPIIAFTLTLMACGGDDNDKTTEPLTVFDIANTNSDFDTLSELLKTTGLDETLDDPNRSFTVFAPTDAAFAALGQETLDALAADPDSLTDILLYHVLTNEVNSANAIAAAGTSVATANGDSINLSLNGSTLMVNSASVTSTDIHADNGVIHIIDEVLIPPESSDTATLNIVETATAAGNFTTLIAALEATQLDALLANPDRKFTVFAPTDTAFAELGQDTINALLADTETLANILQYHVIADNEVQSNAAIAAANSNNPEIAMANEKASGLSVVDGTLYINTSTVTGADIMASNGVIHVIDKVIMPPEDVGAPSQTIAEIAGSSSDLTTLVSALQAANLVSTLANESETFTVFAPTDAAFASIPENTLNAILADADLLQNLLLQHVVRDAAVDSVSAYTLNGKSATTASGAEIPVAIVDGQLSIGEAVISTYDIYATNGVIHIIDSVIVGDLTLP